MEGVEEKMIRGLDRLLLFDDVLVSVLSKLPVKSILRFRCVCKRWLYIISEDPLFIQLHSRQSNSKQHLVFLSYPSRSVDDTWVISSIDMEGNPISRFEVNIGSRCNLELLPNNFDLVCIYDSKTISICNPSTHELITLPPFPRFDIRYEYDPPTVGLGYVESTDEYKVVCLIPICGAGVDDHSITIKCLVFTLGSSTSSSSSSSPSWAWRDVMNCPYRVSYRAPALVNGSLHWLPPYFVEDPMFDPENPILAFDVESEEFRQLPHPKGFPYIRSLPNDVSIRLVELRGLLCLTCLHRNSKMDLWMLKDYESGTWIKEYSIDLNVLSNSSCYGLDYFPGFTPRDIDDTKVLIESDYGFILGYYHLQSKSFKEFIRCGKWFYFSFYMESLRSLGQLQEKALKQENKRKGTLCDGCNK